jgi:hypothetical protein
MEFIDIPTEQTTAITDAILALLALGGALYLYRIGKSDRWKANLWLSVFGLLTVAAVFGTIAHGFKMSTQLNSLLWQPLFLSLGTMVSLFVVGTVYDAWGKAAARKALPVMLVVGAVFYTITLLIPGSFLVFIVYEAAATLFALVAYGWLTWRGRLPGAGLMTLGIFITIVAAIVQATETLTVTVVWPFDYNGLYHLIQMVGLLALLAGLRADLLSGGYSSE